MVRSFIRLSFEVLSNIFKVKVDGSLEDHFVVILIPWVNRTID